MTSAVATCHCGKVSFTVPSEPAEVTSCNCSFCRRAGVLWAYYPKSKVVFEPAPPPTDTYAWNGKHVDFHRCEDCGSLTHWCRSPEQSRFARAASKDRIGINARLLEPDVLERAKVKLKDGASQ